MSSTGSSELWIVCTWCCNGILKLGKLLRASYGVNYWRTSLPVRVSFEEILGMLGNVRKLGATNFENPSGDLKYLESWLNLNAISRSCLQSWRTFQSLDVFKPLRAAKGFKLRTVPGSFNLSELLILRTLSKSFIHRARNLLREKAAPSESLSLENNDFGIHQIIGKYEIHPVFVEKSVVFWFHLSRMIVGYTRSLQEILLYCVGPDTLV